MQPEGIVRAEPTHGDAVQRENCIAHARYVHNVEREQQNATKPDLSLIFYLGADSA